MPIYEYKCLQCSHEFEALQKFSDAPLGVCPKCNGAVKKRVSATTFQLKGSGWYMTDYAKKSSSGPTKESSESSSSETKSSNSSGDSE